MSRNYRFHKLDGAYFVSFAVVEWLDVFTRRAYKEIIVESLKYCQKHKNMEIYAWCLMTNHMHLVFRVKGEESPGKVLGDFKRFTSKAIVKAIIDNSKESRKENFITTFKKAGFKTSNVHDMQFWRHDNRPIEIWSNKVISEKINYIHNNPVEAGWF